MAKQVINNARLYVAGFNLSGDMSALALEFGAEVEAGTVLTDAGIRRLAGLKAARFNHEGYWNGGANNVDDALFARIGVADVPMTVCPMTGIEGDKAYFFKGLTGEYSPGGEVGKMFAFSVSGETDGVDGLIRGTILITGAKTATGNGTGQQLGTVGATQKLFAALHVIAASGTTPTLVVKVQSDDNSGFTSATDRITFTQNTAIGSEYATPVAGPITDDYWRINYTIGGTGPSFTFIVALGIQ